MNLHSDYPFWMIKEGIIQSFPTLRQNIRTQVLVIGGGITGALIAHRIFSCGMQVTVVDKRHVGYGSTSASTSMLQYEMDVPLFQLETMVGEANARRAYQLCSHAIDKIAQLSSKYSDKADFKKYPSLFYASYKKHSKEIIVPEYTARKKLGFDVQCLSNKDIKNRFGFDAPSGILSSQGAQVNPYKLCHYLLRDVAAGGNSVYDLSEIKAWEAGKNGVFLKTSDGFEIHADHIIVACGYETQSYLDKKVTDFNSSYAIVSKPMAQKPIWKQNALIWETKTPYLYMRTTSDNRILVGGRDETFQNPEKRDALLPRKQVQLQADFQKIFPDIPFQIDYSWAGTFAETKDGLPFIGNYDHDRVHFAMGYGGNGIVFSVVAAGIIADKIRGLKNKDAAIFSFDR